MAGVLECDASLAGVAVTQHGAFTRAQAIAAGFGANRIERRVRAGVWERVLPRVYRHSATPPSVGLSYSAAVLWAGPECALSHTTAAAIWRIAPTVNDRPELIVPGTRSPRAAGVIVHRVAHFDAVDVVHIGQLPVTSPTRTIVDLAGVLSGAELETALERAHARGLVTVRALRANLDEIGTTGRPGAARLRGLLAAVGSGPVYPSVRMAG